MIWFDLDNSPHVPLFRPILTDLEKRRKSFLVTSRAHAQTEDLLKLWNIPSLSVGIHGGGNKFSKILNLAQRSNALRKVGRIRQIGLAMSHGSRTHLVAAKRLRIPYVWMQDYEYQEKVLANLLADFILLPACIPDKRIAQSGYKLSKVIRYDGLKEEIYLKDFLPDPLFRKSIGVDEKAILVTMRPPSLTANYHQEKSDQLFRSCLKRLSAIPGVHCMIVNRTAAELGLLDERHEVKGRVEVLPGAVDGLQLLWHSDMFVGGGGTMSREAALLGVPAYSIFSSRRPYVDEHLAGIGKLRFISSEAEIMSLPLGKRSIGSSYTPANTGLATRITDLILDIHDRIRKR